MEDVKLQGFNNDQGNNHKNMHVCKSLQDNKNKEDEWLNNRQDSSDLSGPQSQLADYKLKSTKDQEISKHKTNENELVKFHEDGQTVKQDCIFEQNQRNISHVHNLRKSTRRSVCCLGIESKENVANINKKAKGGCEKQERRKTKRQGNTEKMRMKQKVKTLQRQVSALQDEIACLKHKLSLTSPSTDFNLSSCHRKVLSFAGDVERAPLTPQSDGSATTVRRALAPNSQKCKASRKYFCPKCKRSFNNYSLLCRHVGIHFGKKPYACMVCNKTFNLVNQLNIHKALHSDEQPQQYEESSEGFTNSDPKNHTRMHRDIKAVPKECKVCGKRFSRVCHLLRHSLIHSGHRPHSCNVCDKRFYKSDHLSRHMIIHTGRKPYQCDQCDKSCVTNSDLNMHKMTHSGERLHMCDVCGLRFTRHAHMVRHSKVHTGEKPFYCDICGRSFSRLNHLQRHQKLHLDDPTFRCYLCSSEYGNKERLKEHILSHDIQKILPCTWCGLDFKSQSKLLKHAELHHQKSTSAVGSGDGNPNGSISSSPKKTREHVCDQCDKSYKTSGALVIHKRSHSGERPYICDICAVGFSRSSSLVRHKRSHTGEKPHACQICKKAYARRHLLSKHKRIAHGSQGLSTDDVASRFQIAIDRFSCTVDPLRCDAPCFSSLPRTADNLTPFESSDHVNVNAIDENIKLINF